MLCTQPWPQAWLHYILSHPQMLDSRRMAGQPATVHVRSATGIRQTMCCNVAEVGEVFSTADVLNVTLKLWVQLSKDLKLRCCHPCTIHLT